MSTTKTTAHGADIVARWTVLHGAVVLRQLTKTTAHGAKLFKTRTVSHGAEIVNETGTYRGVMDESTRDALTYTYVGDSVIAEDNDDALPHQFYSDALGWLATAQAQATDEAGIAHGLYTESVYFPHVEGDLEAYPVIWPDPDADPATTATLQIRGPQWVDADQPRIDLSSDDSLSATVTVVATIFQLDASFVVVSAFLTFGDGTTNLYQSAANVLKTDDQFVAADGVQGKYVSGAGRVNGADTDFTVTPSDGMAYTVRNSTNGKVYWTARANGAWKAIELL